MDFATYHLSREIAKTNRDTWSASDVLEKDFGPLFLLERDKTAYNTMDAGNWLWGMLLTV